MLLNQSNQISVMLFFSESSFSSKELKLLEEFFCRPPALEQIVQFILCLTAEVLVLEGLGDLCSEMGPCPKILIILIDHLVNVILAPFFSLSFCRD